MPAAIELVREQLGEEAIIVTTHTEEGTGGVRVTAAVESEDHFIVEETVEELDTLEVIFEGLQRHGTPPSLIDLLLDVAAQIPADDPVLVLAGALDARFRFEPLPGAKAKKPLLLVGPPGTGKTVACAKLAARAVLAGQTAALISADPLRAGAQAQLRHYAEKLGTPFLTADSNDALKTAIAACKENDLVLIDTSGTNPFSATDLVRLADLVSGHDAEILLVLNAGRNADDCRDVVEAFAQLKPARLIATGLDLSRRYGGLLAAAEFGPLAFSDVSATTEIADGLIALNPVSLARLIDPTPPRRRADRTAAHRDETRVAPCRTKQQQQQRQTPSPGSQTARMFLPSPPAKAVSARPGLPSPWLMP